MNLGNEHIVDGLTRRDPDLEFTHVRDVGLASTPDPTILEWTAAHGLVLLMRSSTWFLAHQPDRSDVASFRSVQAVD